MNSLKNLQIKKLSTQDQKDILKQMLELLSVYELGSVINHEDRFTWSQSERIERIVNSLYRDVNNYHIGQLSETINTFVLKRIESMTVTIENEDHKITQFDLFSQ